VDQEVVTFTEDGASANSAKDVGFMVDDIMANKKDFREGKPLNEACNGPELECPEKRPPGNNNEVRRLSFNFFIYVPPGKWIDGVKNVLRAVFSQRIFTNIPISLSGEKPVGVLPFERIERYPMLFPEMAIQ
jgi:hypothetical protein